MRRPLVWFTAAFAIGIAASRATVLGMLAWLGFAIGASLWAALRLRAGRSAAAALIAAAAAAGGLWSAIDLHAASRDPFAGLLGQDVIVEGIVSRPPQVVVRGDDRRTRAAVTVDRVLRRGRPIAVRGTLLVALPGRLQIAYGDRVRARGRLYRPPPPGNPGEASYRDYLRASGIDATMAVRRAADVHIRARGGGNPILTAAYGLRARINAFFTEGLPGAPGAVLSSLLLGDDGGISPSVREAFRSAGLLHILVVSGAQVALVLGSVVSVGRVVRAPPGPTVTAGGAAVAFFALMTGWVPSVGRAAIMALVGVAAVLLRRDRDVYVSLAAAALVLLVTQPDLLANVGFQLSFAATWGLVYLAPIIVARLSFLHRTIRGLVSMTMGAQVAVLPLLAFHFAQISAIGFLANLVVVPLVAALVPAGFIAAAIGVAIPHVGIAALVLLRPCLIGLIFVTEWFARLPGATVGVTPPSLPVVVVMYAALAAAIEATRHRIRVTAPRALAGACVVMAAVILIQAAGASPGLLTLTVLDVGQGDSILLQTPGGAAMLIDGGGDIEGRSTGYDVGAQRVVPALRRLGVRALDVVVLSHPHEDHVGGLVAVLKNFRVNLVLDAGVPHPAPSYAALRHVVERLRIPYRLARRGLRLDLGNGVTVTVLHPDEPLVTGTSNDPHLNGVVLRVRYGAVGALLPGDLEAPIEWQLVDNGDDLASAVLKVGHHGSATSSTPEFLAAVHPAVAVISVGAWNPYGHPHRRTLDALEEAGAAVYRTDQHGAVSITSDGARLWVRTVRAEAEH